MLRILYIAYMVDISRAKSATIKGILTSPKYREIFPMVRLSKIKRSDEYWSIDYEFAGLIQQVEAFTIACGGLKGAITSKRSHWFLSMTLLNPLRQSTIRIFAVKWSKRGVTLLRPLCSKVHAPFVWEPAFTLATFLHVICTKE